MPHRFRKALTSNKSKRIMWLEYVRQGGHVSAKIRGSLSNNGTTWDIFKTIQRAQGTSKHWRWRQNVGDVNDNNDAEPPQQCPLHLLTLTLTSLPPITLLQLNNTHSSTPLDHNACHPFYHNSCMMFYSWHSTTTNTLCSKKFPNAMPPHPSSSTTLPTITIYPLNEYFIQQFKKTFVCFVFLLNGLSLPLQCHAPTQMWLRKEIPYHIHN